MIIELVINIIKLVLKGIIALIPNFGSIALPTGFMEWFQNVFTMSAYFLPLGDFLVMFGIWMLVVNFQIVWKIIQRVWDALPFT